MPLNVLVVGASIAGPTAAYWFARAGANVTVIERFPEFRTAGQQIDVRTVGVTVMQRTPGMEKAVRAKIVQIEAMQLVESDGQVIATLKPTGDPNQQSLISEYEILRGDLSRILVDLSEDNEKVKYVFGEQVASMEQTEKGPIIVEFMNGYPTAEYDLVVACDGANSRTRAIGLGCRVRDHIVALNFWQAFFTAKKDLLNGSTIGGAHTAVGGRFMAIGPGSSSEKSRVVLQSVHPKSQIDGTLAFREASKKGTEALKIYVSERFRGAGWKSEDIIEHMEDSEEFYAAESVQVKAPLYKGRFALVGDAGYAGGPTGSGTSLAIAGAYILAGEICKHKGDLESGLKGYEERMRPILKDLQKIPPGVTTAMAPQTAWGIWIRNQIVRIFCYAMALGPMFSWIGGLFANSFGQNKYDIPDYEWAN